MSQWVLTNRKIQVKQQDQSKLEGIIAICRFPMPLNLMYIPFEMRQRIGFLTNERLLNPSTHTENLIETEGGCCRCRHRGGATRVELNF